MANFKQPFTSGLEAAAEASAKLAEINSVFDEMNAQLSEASAGKIKIIRKARDNNAFSALFGIGNSTKRSTLEVDETTYIVATNPLAKQNNENDIAIWIGNSRGYPCQIKFNGDNFFCEDKAALEKILSLMLSEPEIGQVFRRLISLPTS